MKTQLLIARHGNTFRPDETPRRLGLQDIPLVESGLAQGRALGEHLKKNNLAPDLIFTSELKRAIQTAEQAQKMMGTHLPIHTLAMFNEIDYGPDENKTDEEVIARVGAEALKAWDAEGIAPSGWNVDPKNIIRDWHYFANQQLTEHQGKTILVVTSNGIARFAPYLTGDFAAFSETHKIKIATGALCVFENTSSSQHWKCTDWNVKPTPSQ